MTRLTFILLTLTLTSCGATHHFVPKRPLERGHWEFSAVIHYDLNRMHLPSLVPDVNFYGGLGNGYNLGIGVQSPVFVTHSSLVRYFPAETNDYSAAFFHFNNLFALNPNPQLELGAIYFANAPDVSQSFSIGLGYGFRARDEYNNYSLSPCSWFFGNSPSMIPSFKYTVTGRHIGISYVHYFGVTNRMLAALRGMRDYTENQIVVYRDSVISGLEVGDVANAGDSLTLVMADGYTLSLGPRPQYYPVCGGAFPVPPPPEEAWVRNHGFDRTRQISRNGMYLFSTRMSPDRIRRELLSNDSVVVRDRSADLSRLLSRTNTWTADHSFGIVYTDKIRK